MLNTQSSLQQLARKFEGSIRIEFIKDLEAPESYIDRNLIRLPYDTDNYSMEKRAELIVFLLHEIGHIMMTKRIKEASSHLSIENRKIANLLEDIRIQSEVISYFPASEELYKYIFNGIFEERNSFVIDTKPKRIKCAVDHIISRYTGLNCVYNKEINDRIDLYEKPLTEMLSRYKTDINIEFLSYLEKYCEQLKSIINLIVNDKDEIKKQEEDSKKLEELRLESNSLRNKSSDELNKLGSEFEKKKQDLSSRLSENLKQQKSKELSKLIREAIRQDISNISDELVKISEKYESDRIDMSHSQEISDIDKLIEDLANKSINPLYGLDHKCGFNNMHKHNNHDDDFKPLDIKFKESVYNNLKRFFESRQQESKDYSKYGSLNIKNLSRYYDGSKIFINQTQKKIIRSDIVFILDASGSMEKTLKEDGMSKYVIAFNAYENISKAIDRISKQNITDINTGLIYFGEKSFIKKRFKDKKKISYENARREYLNFKYNNHTILSPALEQALELFNETKENTQKIIILITDGHITSVENSEILTNRKLKPILKNHIKTILVGLGINQHANFLNKSNSLYINDEDNLDTDLSNIIKLETK